MDKSVARKRLAFTIILLGITIGCIGFMNLHFDRLSRYPYQDEADRALIDQYLSDSEIEYIIEYSIAPAQFVQYLGCNGFNIYHIAEYNQLNSYLGYGTSCEMVSRVELTRDKVDVPTLAALMNVYPLDVVDFWFTYGDIYNPNAILVDDPKSLTAMVDTTYTVSQYRPSDLVFLGETIPHDGNIQVSRRMVEPLQSMCDALTDHFGTECGGLVISDGYIDYQSQVDLYTTAQGEYGDQANVYCDYPGHGEHQLGLAIDIAMKDGSDLLESEVYSWLNQYSDVFGFYFTYDGKTNSTMAPRSNHLRYNGILSHETIPDPNASDDQTTTEETLN